MIYKLEKQERYYFQASKKYHKRKKTRWATWNTKKQKIAHQVDKLSEKFNDKLKLLRMRWKEMKKQIKATSSW